MITFDCNRFFKKWNHWEKKTFKFFINHSSVVLPFNWKHDGNNGVEQIKIINDTFVSEQKEVIKNLKKGSRTVIEIQIEE